MTTLQLGGRAGGKRSALTMAAEKWRTQGIEVQVYGPNPQPAEPLKGIPLDYPWPWPGWEGWQFDD